MCARPPHPAPTRQKPRRFKIIKGGDGEFHAKPPTGTVEFHYQGLLLDGDIFTSTYDHGHTIKVNVAHAIPCWMEALPMLVEGDVWDVWCPSELAYGDHKYPHVPAGSVVLFKIEVVAIHGATKVTTKCHPDTGSKCTEKERAYVEKQRGRMKDVGALNAELARLHMLETNGHFKKGDLDWLHVRVVLLKKMIGQDKEL